MADILFNEQTVQEMINVLNDSTKTVDAAQSAINKAYSIMRNDPKAGGSLNAGNGKTVSGNVYSAWKELQEDYSLAKKIVEVFEKAKMILSGLHTDGGRGLMQEKFDSLVKIIQNKDPKAAVEEIKKLTAPLGRILDEPGLSKVPDIAYTLTIDGDALSKSTSYHTIEDWKKIQSAEKGMYEFGRAVGGGVATIVDAALNTVPGVNLDIPTNTVVQIADETGSWFGTAGNIIDAGIREFRSWVNL